MGTKHPLSFHLTLVVFFQIFSLSLLSVSHNQNWHEEMYNMIFTFFSVRLWLQAWECSPLLIFIQMQSEIVSVFLCCSIFFSIRDVSLYPLLASFFKLQRLPCAYYVYVCMCIGVAQLSFVCVFLMSNTNEYIFFCCFNFRQSGWFIL